jgi:membrane protein required for colicin V production
MAIVDIMALVVVLISILWGVVRGFSREIFGLVAWVFAFLLASRWYGLLVPLVRMQVTRPRLADALAFGGLFIALIMILSAVSTLLGRAMRGSALFGGVDALLGGAFGLVRGVAVLSVLYAGASFLMQDDAFAAASAQSRIAPFIYRATLYLEGCIPAFARIHLAPPPESRHDRPI